MLRVFWFFVINFLFLTNSYTQIPGLTQFTIDNGLPSNTIYDIAQDEMGFIWYATDYGVSKFDGINFINYTISDGLPGNEILYFYKDSKKRIWMVSFNGEIGFILNGNFHNHNNTPFLKNLYFTSYIHNIFEDSKGQIWFYQNLSNIYVLQRNLDVKKFIVESDIDRSYSSIFIESLNNEVSLLTYTNKEGKLLVITKPIIGNSLNWEKFNDTLFLKNSVERINKSIGMALRENNPIIKKIYNQLNSKESNYLSKTYKIDKKYWITNSTEGVYIFDESNDFENPNIILKSIQTTRIFIDLENNIWLGSQSNGVFLFPNIHINGIQFENNKKNDLHSVSVFNNKLVVGNELGELLILNPQTLQTETSFALNKTAERTRHLKTHKDNLYVLSDQNIHKLDASFKLTRIKNMFDDDYKKINLKNFKDLSFWNDAIYTATSNGIAKINTNTLANSRLWDKRSSSLLCIKNDSIWIGTTTGLYLQHTKKTEKYNLNDQFNNSIIYALEKTNNGLLIGSNAYGLGVLENGVFKSISTNDGLLSNLIKSIFIDTNNNIWLSTNFGLNCLTLNPQNEIVEIKSYTTSDGLYSNDVRDCYVDSSENKVYIATSKGLNIIDLSSENNSILEPITHITEILLNNSQIDKTTNQQFNYNANNIQFNFSGISFKSLGNITFKYRLKGLENEWIETKNNTVRYSSLPPNTYTFELKSISKSNIENSIPAVFTFTIIPPFYNTWWFKTILLTSIFLLALYLFYRKNQQLKQEKIIKEKISVLQYRALNAQMNPHFINNLIVNIHSLADKGELNEVKESLTNFADLVSLVLRTTKSNLISLNDEVKMVKLYLELQKLRFNKNIEYTINLGTISQDEFNNILVPPMILQPIVENSIKHGFKNSTGINTITINFNIENNEFINCEISDNGLGIHNENSTKKTDDSGISLENINNRIQLISASNKEENFVFITNLTNEFNKLAGSKVTLKIPLISF
jgi:ligand-binding sensor domain-containing protein